LLFERYLGKQDQIWAKIFCIPKNVRSRTLMAGHAHKLDVKLQSLCGSDFSLVAVRVLAKPHWPRRLCENKDGVYFFALRFECHNRLFYV